MVDLIKLNIYADEIQSKLCPYTGDKRDYIGLIIEDMENPILEEIINIRFCSNFDEQSPYYEKNNRLLHRVDLVDVDRKNICKRYVEYVLDPKKSGNKFYCYILGINHSKLNKDRFNKEDEFNSRYNRFFRTALLFTLKSYFPGKKILVENIFHEEGQQKDNKYFPRHSIKEIDKKEDNISFNCKEIIFLPKDHKEDRRSNLIQLCDIFLGLSASIIHGIEESKRSKYKEEIANLYLPLFKRLIEKPKNTNSSYKHYNRISINFFPEGKININGLDDCIKQFYTKRLLKYEQQKIEKETQRTQPSLF